jgi:hypothetical protein
MQSHHQDRRPRSFDRVMGLIIPLNTSILVRKSLLLAVGRRRIRMNRTFLSVAAVNMIPIIHSSATGNQAVTKSKVLLFHVKHTDVRFR